MFHLWRSSPIFTDMMQPCQNCTLFNRTIMEPTPCYWFLFLGIFPVVCIFGNSLVVAAIWTNRSLQNSTNFLLISLAVADLLVGTFVMPFSIYLAVNRLHWHFPHFVCNVYCVFDVSASTASIINLVLISMDRLVAVARHTEYQTNKHRRRVRWSIFGCWFFSVAVGLPLGIGLNFGNKEGLDELHHCGIINPNYMLFSSVFAFYIPCIVMLGTYSFIFHRLKLRLSALQLQEMAAGHFMSFGADISNIAQTAIGIAAGGRSAMVSWEKPFIQRLEATVRDEDSEINDSERRQLATILESVPKSSSNSVEIQNDIAPDPVEPPSPPSPPMIKIDPPSNPDSDPTSIPVATPKHLRKRKMSDALVQSFHSQATEVAGGFRRLSSVLSPGDPSLNFQHAPQVHNKHMRRLSEVVFDFNIRRESIAKSASNLYVMARRESLAVAREKLSGLKDWALDLLAKIKSRQGMAIRKEKRATKLVTTVMIVFLICWLPFFTWNIFKVYMLWQNNWTASLEAWFHFFSWLGYLNSCLNPAIYTLINQKFRLTFMKLLRLGSGRQKTWILPPKVEKRSLWNRICCNSVVEYFKTKEHSYKRQTQTTSDGDQNSSKWMEERTYDLTVAIPNVATIEEEPEDKTSSQESDDEDVNHIFYV